MATDIEQFVDQDERDAAIKEVRRQIDAEGVTYMYYQFVSVTGRIMGKGMRVTASLRLVSRCACSSNL